MTAFAAACGVKLDEWQSYVLDGLFAVTESGQWAATEFGLLVARQNGKGEILVAYDLAHLFLFPREDNRRKTILHTAHEMKTAIDGFQRLKGVIESQPQLMARVARVYTANGQEGIVLKPRKGQALGDRIKFVARSKNSGRGFSGDIVVQDEAQEESRASHDALTYTQSAVPNRQEFLTGTVPEDGVNESEVFEGVRDRGREAARAGDGGSRTGWMEWTPTGSDDPKLAPSIDRSDPAVWLEANPAAPHRITLETIQDQHDRDTSPEHASFSRERLSIWPDRAEVEDVSLNDLDLEVWRSGVVDEPPAMEGRTAVIAPVVADGGGYGSIAVGWRTLNGSIYVEHVDTRAQTAWIPARVRELKESFGIAAVVMDERKNASIIAGMTREGVAFLRMNATEVAAAYALTVEQINAGLVCHRDQSEVDISLRHAQPRKVGAYGFTWTASDASEPVSQMQAITNAVWGVNHLEANPPKRGRVRGIGG